MLRRRQVSLAGLVAAFALPFAAATGRPAGFMPLWYQGHDGTGFAGGGSGDGGLFSSSGVPDLGGMFATLGTIGSAPSSSSGGAGGGGGGGFSGGSSGGGGGAGGGF